MIHLVVDSGGDISKEFAESENCTFSCVPLNLQIDETVYIDDENLDLLKYLEHMEASPNPVKTSAPSPSLFLERFKLGDSVFVVTLSSKLSASYQSAVSAKDMYIEEYGKKFIHVVDSFTAAMGEGAVAMKIAELARSGKNAQEILEQITEYVKTMRTFFILDKFDNSVKTGRVKPYVAKIASVLNVKPICTAFEGEIKMLDKARGFQKALGRMIEIMKDEVPDIENRFIGLTHVQAYEKALAVKEELIKHLRPRDVIIQEPKGVTVTYANRGSVVLGV